MVSFTEQSSTATPTESTMTNYIFPSEEITFYKPSYLKPVGLKKFLLPVECGGGTTGFPSPADDYVEGILDLNDYLGIKRHACYLVEAKGDSMIDAGISEKDILVVDTTLDYQNDDIVICSVNGTYKAKIIKRINNRYFLYSKNPDFEPIEIQEQDDVQVFGVVRGLTRKFR